MIEKKKKYQLTYRMVVDKRSQVTRFGKTGKLTVRSFDKIKDISDKLLP